MASDKGEEENFEKDILKNGKRFSEVFERIFEKYDRVFTGGEYGAAEIESDTDIEHLLNDDDPVDPLSAILELSSDEGSSEDREEVAALLHQQVVKVKKEINWDEEELQHQQKQQLKALCRECSSDEESDDEWQNRAPGPPPPRRKRIRPLKGNTSKNGARLKLSVSVAATDMSGYEDLNSTDCNLETCLEDYDVDFISEVTSAPEESDRASRDATRTILSKSMCELRRGNIVDYCSEESGTDNERHKRVANDQPVRTATRNNLINRVQSNEVMSGYSESELHDPCDSDVHTKDKEDSETENDFGYQDSCTTNAAIEHHCVSELHVGRVNDCLQHSFSSQSSCGDTAHEQEANYCLHNSPTSLQPQPHVHCNIETTTCECVHHIHTPPTHNITQCCYHHQYCPQHFPSTTHSPYHCNQNTFHGLPPAHCPNCCTNATPIVPLPSFGLDCSYTGESHCERCSMSGVGHCHQRSVMISLESPCRGSAVAANVNMNVVTPRSMKKRSLNDHELQSSSSPRTKRQCT